MRGSLCIAACIVNVKFVALNNIVDVNDVNDNDIDEEESSDADVAAVVSAMVAATVHCDSWVSHTREGAMDE